MVAAALIDRLVHHATMITLKGKSYRRSGSIAPRLRLSGGHHYKPVVHFSTAQTGALFGCA
jgi:hypothetical protein